MMKIEKLLLFVLIALSTPGCGPALQQSVAFTPQKVKEIQFNDHCRLQAYFDENPPELYAENETFFTFDEAGAQSGHATFRLQMGRQTGVFFSLLKRFYRRLPELDHHGQARVTVAFYSDGQGAPRKMPIGADLGMVMGSEEISLPYHPCLASFFYGRPLYTIRRKLIHQQTLAARPE